MLTIEHKEIDEVGEQTLDAINNAERFNRWMYDTIHPFVSGRVLEIGSGIGNMSEFFLDDGFQIHLTDIRAAYCKRLNEKFENHPSFLGAEIMDLIDPDFYEKFSDQFGTYDTIFSLNVVEHISDDLLAIGNAKKLLKKGGRLITLVPSYQALYNTFDVELGHFRRYTKSNLSALYNENDLKIIHRQYFNLAGILGWFISGHIQDNESIPKGQMDLYNNLVPVFKIVDKLFFNSVGLSTVVVGEKKD